MPQVISYRSDSGSFRPKYLSIPYCIGALRSSDAV